MIARLFAGLLLFVFAAGVFVLFLKD